MLHYDSIKNHKTQLDTYQNENDQTEGISEFHQSPTTDTWCTKLRFDIIKTQ